MAEALLIARNITKTYPGVVALKDFSIQFEKGEVHALLGENGAGKSTLIKIISGAIEPDCGLVVIDGHEFSRLDPHASRQHGIAVIYQEFSLVDSLTIAQNIFLGSESGFLVNYDDLNRRVIELFNNIGVGLDPRIKVRTLSPAQKQLVEIAKAVARDAKILIMDEPTAPLSASEVDTLFSIIVKLKRSGVTVIYISHRIEELFQISDRVTVMRDGQFVKTLSTRQTNRQELINLMVGRELREYYPRRKAIIGKPVLEVQNICGNGDIDISFTLHHGEILGIAGLVGSGRTELVNLIYGTTPKDGGRVMIFGNYVQIRNPREAIANGIGLIPEDRKNHGCILNSDIFFNINLSVFNKFAKNYLLDFDRMRKTAQNFSIALSIRTPGLQQRVRNLSGGNQQKVVLAKTLAAESNILIFDEPTRGIDVGTKQEIYKLMVELVEQGKSIIMISSEMEELLGMSDRLIVLYEGRLMGEIPRERFDQTYVIEMASGNPSNQ